MGSFSMQAAAINLTSLLPRRDFRSPLPRMSIIGETQNLGKLKLGELLVATRLWSTPTAAPFSYAGTRAGHTGAFGWSGHWTFHGEDGDIRRDAGHLQLFQLGKTIEDVSLQDLHPGLIEDDRLQFDAFAQAIANGNGSGLDAGHNARYMGTHGSMQRVGSNARKS